MEVGEEKEMAMRGKRKRQRRGKEREVVYGTDTDNPKKGT